MLNRPGVLGSLIILVAFVVLVIVTVIRYSNRGTSSTALLHPDAGKQRFETAWSDLPEVQPFELIERSGEPVSMDDLQGKPWVGSFFFSRCPSICKQQNETLQRFQAQLRKAEMDITLVSISVDPAYDTPEVLSQYAKTYNADPDQWLFLTGAYDKIVTLGNESFGLPIGPETHSTSLLLVDRWGRFRDRYDWEQPTEIKRLQADLKTCLAETEPPTNLVLKTRVPAASDVSLIAASAKEGAGPQHEGETTASQSRSQPAPTDAASADEAWREKQWIDEFTLTNSESQPFGSEDLKGKVWVANTFFTRCPTICKQMMAEVKTLHDAMPDKPVTWVSITSDSDYDTPPRLKAYAENFEPDPQRWQFLTGDLLYSRRIMSEFLSMYVDLSGPMHDEHLVLVDKWGKVRGKYPFDDRDALVQLRMDIDHLIQETEPPAPQPPMSNDLDDLEDDWDADADDNDPTDGVSIGNRNVIDSNTGPHDRDSFSIRA